MPNVNLYESILPAYTENGWLACHDTYIESGRFIKDDWIGDKMWSQAYYGIYLGLSYSKTKNVKYYNMALELVDGTISLLSKTNNIFLRDNSDIAVNSYLSDTEKNSEMEASKDQILGLITALYFIFHYINNPFINDKIKKIVDILDMNLYKYAWFLNTGKRDYNSANYCMVHYGGINAARKEILHGKEMVSILEPIFSLVSKICLNINVENYFKYTSGEMWFQKLPLIKNINGIKSGVYPFNINLCFFEFVIMGTASKESAIKIVADLDKASSRALNNINLGAAYVYLCRLWGIEGSSVSYYKKMVDATDYAFYASDLTIPNESNLGMLWYGQDHYNNHVLFSDEELNHIKTEQSLTMGTHDDLMNSTTKIRINNGIHYLCRNALMY